MVVTAAATTTAGDVHVSEKEMKEEEEKVNRKEIAAASLELVPERLPVQIVVSGTSAIQAPLSERIITQSASSGSCGSQDQVVQ